VTFNYAAPAEVFMPNLKRGRCQALSYRRFTTTAEAIRFAIADFPALRALGAWMQVGGERASGDEIHFLYEASDYPMPRRTPD
jgi:hypothetical protein